MADKGRGKEKLLTTDKDRVKGGKVSKSRSKLHPRRPRHTGPSLIRSPTSLSPVSHAAAPPSTSHVAPPHGTSHFAAQPRTSHARPSNGTSHVAPQSGTSRVRIPFGASHSAPPIGTYHTAPPTGTSHFTPPLGTSHVTRAPGTSHITPPPSIRGVDSPCNSQPSFSNEELNMETSETAVASETQSNDGKPILYLEGKGY